MSPSPVHRATFERVAERLGLALEVVRVELLDLETGGLDLAGNTASEMASTRDGLPDRLDSLLPARDAGVGRVTVLDEMQPRRGLQDPAKFCERARQVGNRAHRPGRHRGVEAPRW